MSTESSTLVKRIPTLVTTTRGHNLLRVQHFSSTFSRKSAPRSAGGTLSRKAGFLAFILILKKKVENLKKASIPFIAQNRWALLPKPEKKQKINDKNELNYLSKEKSRKKMKKKIGKKYCKKSIESKISAYCAAKIRSRLSVTVFLIFDFLYSTCRQYPSVIRRS